MDMNKYCRRAKQFLGTLDFLERPCRKGATILDFGCGAGNLVEAFQHAGLNAYGCDLAFKDGPHVEHLAAAGTIRRINSDNYSLPFEDQSFDMVVSDQVFEHVQDYGSALSEIARVLKTDGATLHIIPSRLKPIEPHVYVPLGTIFQNYPWLLLWAVLGIRKENQHGMRARDVALDNMKYLRSRTNYLRRRDIQLAFSKYFSTVHFCETALAQHLANGRFRIFNRMPFNIFSSLISSFHNRAIYAERPKIV